MPFQISPGVLVIETDLSTIVPNVATTGGGFVGAFRWGPVRSRILLSTEVQYVIHLKNQMTTHIHTTLRPQDFFHMEIICKLFA